MFRSVLGNELFVCLPHITVTQHRTMQSLSVRVALLLIQSYRRPPGLAFVGDDKQLRYNKYANGADVDEREFDRFDLSAGAVGPATRCH